MTTPREKAIALLAETEEAWTIALKAHRAASAKEKEYRAALLAWVEWIEAETKKAQIKEQNE